MSEAKTPKNGKEAAITRKSLDGLVRNDGGSATTGKHATPKMRQARGRVNDDEDNYRAAVDEHDQKSTLSNAKGDAAAPKKRQKVQPFKFLPPDSFGKSKPGMLEHSKPQQIKAFPKPSMAASEPKEGTQSKESK